VPEDVSSETAMPLNPRIAVAKPSFDVQGFLRSSAAGTTIATYRALEIIFSPDDASDSVMYLQDGEVKLSVVSRDGKEAIIAMLAPDTFFGESGLAGRPVRREFATAMSAATVLIIPREQMIRLLHEHQEFSDRFIAHTLARNIRTEEDLIDQLFNSGEKRLARALLLLAHYGQPGQRHRVLPPISQQVLAEMVGTTRSRVNFFMNKFRKLGYIEYDVDGLKVNDSLITIMWRDDRDATRTSKAV
jgi:CRP/FNR family transcriptional regulator, cyclic AMP receptor protein